MRKNKSLSSTSTAHFDTSSKPVQSYAKNARLSITNKTSSEGPSSPYDNYRNGLQSQAEREITYPRDYKSSRAQNTPVSEKDLEHRNSCHSVSSLSNKSTYRKGSLPETKEATPDPNDQNHKMKTGNLNMQGLNAYYRQTFGYGHKRTSSDDQMKRYSSQSGNSPIFEQIHLMNGVVLEPKLLFEGKAYSLVSINNGLRLPRKKKSEKSQGYFDISKLFGVKYADDGSEILNKKENKKHENYENSLDDENSEANLEDLNAFLQDQEINPFDPDEDAQERKHFNKRISKLLQERYMPTGEGTPRSSHYLKKHLSVILSTGKSMEISSDSRNSIENEEKEENVKPEPVNIDHNNYENEKKDKEIQPQTLKVESISISVSTKEKNLNKEIQAILEREHIIPKTIPNIKTNNDPNTEEDVVLNAINSIKQQNKENKALEKTLTKLTDVYNKRIEKYDEKFKRVVEKCERYKETNKSLGKVIKKWEGDIDKLAATNKKLHDLVVGLEEELEATKIKEKKLQIQSKDQKHKITKLTEQAKKDSMELEEAKKQISTLTENLKEKDEKLAALTSYTQKSDELIHTVSSTFRTVIAEKLANNISIDNLFRFLENIEGAMIETSKFIGELEANSPTNASLSRSREPTFRSKSKNSHEEKKSFNNKNDSKPLLASSNEASLAVDNNNSESQKQQGVSLHKKLSEKARSGSKSHSKSNSGNSNSFDVFLVNPQSPQRRASNTTSPLSKSSYAAKSKSPSSSNYLLKKTLMKKLMSPSDKKELSLSLPQNIVEDPGKPSDKEELPADINKTKAKEKRMSYSQDRNSKRY